MAAFFRRQRVFIEGNISEEFSKKVEDDASEGRAPKDVSDILPPQPAWHVAVALCISIVMASLVSYVLFRMGAPKALAVFPLLAAVGGCADSLFSGWSGFFGASRKEETAPATTSEPPAAEAEPCEESRKDK
eukprot:TRINITY_DN82720_c0_g1_i1.p2 TRINITY_DN82720_c0_g1~~TRINITY_DN82720_c0_g1_i1.p2  ORF type:complete len:153 (-),score=22.81 TRINITY_DN82720_c0_g1_i1:222-617(-)